MTRTGEPENQLVMGGEPMSIVLAALLPITVLQLTLIHIDHAVPPRCINVLDITCGTTLRHLLVLIVLRLQ
jgi:hypothetical protein